MNTELDRVREAVASIDVMAVMDRLMSAPCDECSGDCGSANPPVIGCPQREAIEARAAIAAIINYLRSPEFAGLVGDAERYRFLADQHSCAWEDELDQAMQESRDE